MTIIKSEPGYLSRYVDVDAAIEEYDTREAREAGEELLDLVKPFNSPHPERLAGALVSSCIEERALPLFVSARDPETAMQLPHYIAAFDGDLVPTQGPGKKGTHADNFVRKQSSLGSNFACFTDVSHPDHVRSVIHATVARRPDPTPMMFAVGEKFDVPPDMIPFFYNVAIDPAPGFDPVEYMNDMRCAYDAANTLSATCTMFLKDGKRIHILGEYPKHVHRWGQRMSIAFKLAGYSRFSIN